MRGLIVVLSAVLIAVLSFERGRTSASAVRAAQVPAVAPFDWAAVSSRDLNVAGIFLTARAEGLTKAMDSLAVLAVADSMLMNGGHMIAHALGRFAIANNGHNPAVLSTCRPTFQAGCYHGVLEGYLTSLPRVDAPSATRLCSGLERSRPSLTRGTRIQAYGLGHGFIEALHYNLLASLDACDTFAVGELRVECHYGVFFMENTVHGSWWECRAAQVSATAPARRTCEGLGTQRPRSRFRAF